MISCLFVFLFSAIQVLNNDNRNCQLLVKSSNKCASPPVLTGATGAHTCDPGEPEGPGMSEEQTQAKAGEGQLSSSL